MDEVVNVVVLVPRRDDDGPRDEVWQWVEQRWATEHPEWALYAGHHNRGRFNRSAAINQAAKAAGEWDVAIIADSDSFCGPDQLTEAVRLASDGAFVLAYDSFMYLSEKGSRLIMDGFRGWWEQYVEWSLPGTCSSMVVVSRPLWDEVGGFDTGFKSWGNEDGGFANACTTFAPAGIQRVHGAVWHLFHPPSPENNTNDPKWQANVDRGKRYGDALGDKTKMSALLAELGVKTFD